MNKDPFIIDVVLEETMTYSYTEICNKYNISKELLVDMLEQGLFPDQPTQIELIALDQKAMHRIETAFRLHRDLEINLPGVTLAIELIEKMEQMDQELAILRKHF